MATQLALSYTVLGEGRRALPGFQGQREGLVGECRGARCQRSPQLPASQSHLPASLKCSAPRKSLHEAIRRQHARQAGGQTVVQAQRELLGLGGVNCASKAQRGRQLLPRALELGVGDTRSFCHRQPLTRTPHSPFSPRGRGGSARPCCLLSLSGGQFHESHVARDGQGVDVRGPRGTGGRSKDAPCTFEVCPRPKERVPLPTQSSAMSNSSVPSVTSQPGGQPGSGRAEGSAEPRAVPLSPPSAPAGPTKVDDWRKLLEKQAEEIQLRLSASEAAEESEDEAAAAALDPQNLDLFLQSRLPVHPKLHRGTLSNGLQYIILPNTVPPNRFEAHLEMHVGSVDEEDVEQGLAHLVEHVTFLGSRKREKLLGTGARSNAYTDFHHTVFHVHAPCSMQGSGEPMLPLVLEALHEIAFQPRFLPTRIDKERRAVLSEAQMMNTIEYRVDCQLLQHLHSENKIGCRFPIGKEEQVPHWSVDTIRAFHRRWYFPANATLYVVGDVGSVSQTVRLIEKEFGKIPPGLEDPAPTPTPDPTSAPPSPSSRGTLSPLAQQSAVVTSFPASSATPGTAPPFSLPSAAPAPAPAAGAQGVPPPLAKRKRRHAVRPPVKHNWARQKGSAAPKAPAIFQHELLQNFALSVFCKNPVRPVKRYRELRAALMARIASYALQFRINKRYKSGEIPFMSISLDHSDSAREGTVVSTLTVISEPQHWEGAVRLAVQEVRRLKEFGLTAGELTRYLTALMKDSEHVAAMLGTIPSLDNLDFIMENDALGHTIMDQEQAHDCLSAVAPTITLEDVNEVAAEILEYIADYGRPGAPHPAAIVACVPTHMHPLSAPTSSTALVDAGAGPQVLSDSSDESSVPFVITPEAIECSLKEGLQEPLLPEPEIEVPRALLPDSALKSLVEAVRPHFVPLPSARGEPLPAAATHPSLRLHALAPASGTASALASAGGAEEQGQAGPGPLVLKDPDTGIILRRLSNGIRLNMKVTENEAKGGMIRLVVPGGRVEETNELPGAVAIGVRTLSESGSVGDFSLEQVELFCLANQINCALEADEEFICMDLHFSSRHGGLRATFQLLHMFLQNSVWHEDALDRAKQLYLSHFRSLPKSLERFSAYTMLKAMFAEDQRLLEPTPEAIARLTLEGVQDAVLQQLLSGHMEVSVVGDFNVEEVEQLALEYLGTVTAFPCLESGTGQPLPVASKAIPMVEDCSRALRHQRVNLRDTDERARAYIAGAAPNRWGFTADGRDVNTLMEPVPMTISEPRSSAAGRATPRTSSGAGANAPAPASQEAAGEGMLGRLIKGFFGGGPAPAAPEMEERGPGGSARAQGGAAPGAPQQQSLYIVSAVEQAKAMAPLGVTVVEGPDGRPYWRKRRHPLFAATGMMLLTEVINARLFTTVRDALGLTYDVTFEISTFDRMPMGWFVISVTSTPDKISQAVEASINVLQGVQANRITQRELDRAKRTLLMRHESDLKDNGYWLGLLTHIQCDAVPRKDVTCIRDLPTLYEVMTVEDVYAVYDQLLVDEKSLFTCIGIAGNGEGAAAAGEESAAVEEVLADVYPAGVHSGRGTSMMTRPTE